jgi:hypothetical protein
MTAMQELIFWGKVLLKKYPENELSFSEVIDKAEMLLETEHKQLVDAYNQGHIDRNNNVFKLPE